MYIREYLTTHPEEAKRYSDVKRALVKSGTALTKKEEDKTNKTTEERPKLSMLEYRDNKQWVVTEMAEKAKQWAEENPHLVEHINNKYSKYFTSTTTSTDWVKKQRGCLVFGKYMNKSRCD